MEGTITAAIRSISAATLLLITTAALSADDVSLGGVTTSEDGATVSYDARFFDQYSPITAQDMLRWIPGTADIVPDESGGGGGGGPDRGFGSGGDQVLINGKRFSGKSISISTALQRIQARNVTRIDLIRGTASGLDVRSDGILINIILSESAASGSGSWQAHLGNYGKGQVRGDGLVSYSGSRGSLNYLLSAEYGPYNRGDTSYEAEEFRDALTGTITKTRHSVMPKAHDATKLNASGSWTFGNSDVLNLNGQAGNEKETEDRYRVAMIPESGETISTLEVEESDEFGWEFGGDLVNKFGPGQLKTRVILTSEDGDSFNSVSRTSSTLGSLPGDALVEEQEKQTEKIIRSSYSWPVAQSNSFEVGLEGAANSLEKSVRLFEQEPDGGLVEIPLSNSDSEVIEDRYELFATFFWIPASNMVLESALNIERSQIEQLGLDVDNSREFTYYKPRLDFRWDLNGSDQVRATVERTVSQLDFGDFIVSFDADENRIVGGNPNLEPEKAWEYAVTYEHRLGGDLGVVSAKGFFNNIEDHIDLIEILPDVSGPGNIDDAEVYGVELKGSFRLDNIGVRGAVVDLVYMRRDSNTVDAFTGNSRVMNDTAKHEVDLSFRHEITRWRLNYLFDIGWRSYRYDTDIDYSQRELRKDPKVNFTLQYRPTDGPLTIYFQVRNSIEVANVRERTRYDGHIADGIPLRDEWRERLNGREYILGLRGQF